VEVEVDQAEAERDSSMKYDVDEEDISLVVGERSNESSMDTSL
jgi:hypothetical protein